MENKKMFSDWVNKLQIKNDELNHRNKMLITILEELDRDIEMLKFKIEPSKGSSIARHFDRIRKTIKECIEQFGC